MRVPLRGQQLRPQVRPDGGELHSLAGGIRLEHEATHLRAQRHDLPRLVLALAAVDPHLPLVQEGQHAVERSKERKERQTESEEEKERKNEDEREKERTLLVGQADVHEHAVVRVLDCRAIHRRLRDEFVPFDLPGRPYYDAGEKSVSQQLGRMRGDETSWIALTLT